MKLDAYKHHDDRWKPTASSTPVPERASRDTIDLPAGAREWLANGERSVASETIFQYMTGLPINRDRVAHPHNAPEFCRCMKLFEAVPEFATRIDELRWLSTAWGVLVPYWPVLLEKLEREAPEWRIGRGIAPGLNALLATLVDPPS